jgi:hypothetical protein
MSFANDPRRGGYYENHQFEMPPDPIALGAEGKRAPNVNSATGRVLFHQSHMPLGCHAGKIMERVPAEHLLWIRNQPFARNDLWFPVWSYVDRHHEEIKARALAEKPAAREYNLIIHTRLISATEAGKTRNAIYRCELCHDEEKPCDCDPATRTARNQARKKK